MDLMHQLNGDIVMRRNYRKPNIESLVKNNRELPAPPPGWKFPREWNLDQRKVDAITVELQQRRSTHGMFANVPMLCNGEQCPFALICGAWQAQEAHIGDRCVPEIALVMTNTDRYLREFGIDPNKDDHFADFTLVKELVAIEVMIERCEKRLSLEYEVVDVPVLATKNSEVYTKKEVNASLDIRDKHMRRRHEILRLLQATRADKKQLSGNTGAEVADRLLTLDAEVTDIRKDD